MFPTSGISKKGDLITKESNGKLVLYRFEACERPKKIKDEEEYEKIFKSFDGKKVTDYDKCTKEINKYVPERKDTKKYYWGLTRQH